MIVRTSLSLLLAVAGVVGIARAQPPSEWVGENMSSLIELYRWFHQHPELSNYEEQTAARLAKEWQQAGYEVHTGIGGHGIVGILKNGAGPTVMLRTDMDALPVIENTGLVYASQVTVKNKDGSDTGVMHACGHDMHMTNLTGVARFLASHKDAWSGTLMLIGQPSEERGEGARRMLEDGLYERFPKPDMAIALHCDGALATGKIGYRAGYALANVDSVDVVMHGRGGHGAAPHTVIDPIVQAAQFITSVQTIVSREMDPIAPGVVTIGSIRGGTKHNVVPDSCKMQLTVRSYTPEVRKQILDGIRRKADAVAKGAGAPPPTVTVLEEFTPALFNDEELVQRVVPVFQRLLGEGNVVASQQAMGGEDFSRYAADGVPIFMFRLGTIEPKRLAGLTRGGMQPPSLHSAKYFPDPELALQTGVPAMCDSVLRLMPSHH
mgnify:CR=1 FL=1